MLGASGVCGKSVALSCLEARGRGTEGAELSGKCLTRQPLCVVWVMRSGLCSPSSCCFTAENKRSHLEKLKTGFNCISD